MATDTPKPESKTETNTSEVVFPLFLEPTYDAIVGKSGIHKEILIPLSFTHISSVLYAMEKECPKNFHHHLLQIFDPVIFTAYMNFWRAYSNKEPIHDIACRTIFITGTDDPWTTDDSLKEILDKSVLKVRDRLGKITPKCASVKLCDSCGHLPMLTNTEKVKKILLDFFPTK